jgi:hypothetical protein
VTIQTITGIVNGIALAVFLLLLGATLMAMGRRIHDYRAAGMPLPVILKRGFVLFATLGVIGAEATALRVLDIVPAEGSIERLLFTVQYDLILLGALAYYAKTELFDIDDPDKP